MVDCGGLENRCTARYPGFESLSLRFLFFNLFLSEGEVLEWLKRHAWKACIRQKRIGGSNPPHSAPNTALTFIKVGAFFIPVSRFPLFLACSMGGIDGTTGTTECRLALAAHRRRLCLHRDCLHVDNKGPDTTSSVRALAFGFCYCYFWTNSIDRGLASVPYSAPGSKTNVTFAS